MSENLKITLTLTQATITALERAGLLPAGDRSPPAVAQAIANAATAYLWKFRESQPVNRADEHRPTGPLHKADKPTEAMKQRLAELGFTRDQITAMSLSEANNLITHAATIGKLAGVQDDSELIDDVRKGLAETV